MYQHLQTLIYLYYQFILYNRISLLDNFTYIFYSIKNNNKINYLKNKNIYPIYLPLDKNKHVNCKEILVTMGLLGYKNVLIEGGYNTIKRFMDLKLIDTFYFFNNNETANKKTSHSFKNIYMILKKLFQ